ncbi:unnamed protein product [Withania somnifera]
MAFLIFSSSTSFSLRFTCICEAASFRLAYSSRSKFLYLSTNSLTLFSSFSLSSFCISISFLQASTSACLSLRSFSRSSNSVFIFWVACSCLITNVLSTLQCI